MNEDTRTPDEREQAAAIIEAFKKRQQEAQEAQPENPLQETATRFPPPRL